MSNPYQPPGASESEPPAPDARRRTLGFFVQCIVVGLGIGGLCLVASMPARHHPYVALTGPFWYLRSGSDVVGGIALAAFCLTGFASVYLLPRWYTALFAALSILVWFGTSFYMLVLTAPD